MINENEIQMLQEIEAIVTPPAVPEAEEEQPDADQTEEEVDTYVESTETISDILGVPEAKEDEADEDDDDSGDKDTVPLSKYMKLKKELKELKKSDVSTSNKKDDVIDTLIEKYGDEYRDFISDIVSVTSQSVESVSNEYKSLIEQQAMKEQEAQRNGAFDKVFDSFVENNPAYKDIVNKTVIKQLVFSQTDKTKKVSEIIKDVYGNVKTKQPPKSLDGYNTNKSEDIDFSRPTPEQMKLINNDKNLQKKYGDYLVSMSQ